MSSELAVFNSPGHLAMDLKDKSSARYEAALTVWERLRELVQKAALEPYAKEIVYAAPLSALAATSRRREVAPGPCSRRSSLKACWRLPEVTDRSSSAQDESLRFNTAVWQDCASAQ